jgi:hypothetical protein
MKTSRLGFQKVRATLNMLRNIWKTGEKRLHTKNMIFNSNVKSVLLYGSKTWRITGRNTKRLQSFINRCLHYILGIKLYDKVTNECLWVKTGQAKIEDEISKRKCRWIVHTLRKPQGTITRH